MFLYVYIMFHILVDEKRKASDPVGSGKMHITFYSYCIGILFCLPPAAAAFSSMLNAVRIYRMKTIFNFPGKYMLIYSKGKNKSEILFCESKKTFIETFVNRSLSDAIENSS